ncbi:MAG: helix-turn-helix domain-containing protein, partial [Solirubrobacteraceae bacterium]
VHVRFAIFISLWNLLLRDARVSLMEGELQRTLGRNLRAYRKAHDLSQENFAEIMGVHRTYMGGVERGERNLTLRSLERMAGRLEIDPLELLRPSDDNGQAPPPDP